MTIVQNLCRLEHDCGTEITNTLFLTRRKLNTARLLTPARDVTQLTQGTKPLLDIEG